MRLPRDTPAQPLTKKIDKSTLKEEAMISRKDGSKFKLISVQENKKKGKSPLEDIKAIKANVTMNDILDAIRESRER